MRSSRLGAVLIGAGTVDVAVSPGGQYLYVQAGGPGSVDASHIGLAAR